MAQHEPKIIQSVKINKLKREEERDDDFRGANQWLVKCTFIEQRRSPHNFYINEVNDVKTAK